MKEIIIVYHGLGMAGKTTNLDRITQMYNQYIVDRFHHKTLEDRTVYLDTVVFYVPLKSSDEKLKVRLFSTPGQERFAVLRPWITAIADGFVFVVDPTQSVEDNIKSFKEIYREDSIKPIVVQINKTDTKSDISVFKEYFKRFPVIVASAKEGIGVKETLVSVIKAIIDSRSRR